MLPRFSVIVITYNQEYLIGRALDSLLCQKEFLYEIVVSDDCSRDKTWDVIQEYYQKHPDLIKPYRNPQNLGIFGNIESTWSKVSGDVIFYLSGDDIFCNGLFKNADQLIAKNNVDLENDLFTLYFDWKTIDPQGNEKVYSNALVKKYNPVSLKLRRLIQNRTTGIGKKVLEKFYPVRKDVGIIADELIDIQTQIFSKINLYSPFVGSAYITDIGIVSKTKTADIMRSYGCVSEILLHTIDNLTKSDTNWLMYRMHKINFSLKPSARLFLSYLLYLIKTAEFKYGYAFVFSEIKNFGGLILRAILHKQ
jgi:glycosyltransferase involved in cell wall biosynthesis